MFEPHITRDALIKMKTEIQYKRGVCRIEDIEEDVNKLTQQLVKSD